MMLVLLCAPSRGVYAQASNYLDALKQEASSLKLDQGTKTTAERSPVSESGVGSLGSGNSGGIEGLTPGLGKQQFERYLKSNYMGSYLFYRRLNEGHRAEVYRFYLENPDPALIRQKILEIHKN